MADTRRLFRLLLPGRIRRVGNRRSMITVTVLVALFAWLVPAANAHVPAGLSWLFTCSGGDGILEITGACYQHHSNATATFTYEASVGQQGWTAQVDAGYQAWDQTDGHEFNFYKESNDTPYNANVRVTSSVICGDPAAVGCTGMGASGGHTNEGSALIQFRTTMATNLVNDVAAHEFGHYLSLGHSVDSQATMFGGGAFQGMVTLAFPDRLGRCQVYYHSGHFWYGGC